MELNTETKQQLEKLLAKPTLVTQEHIPMLQNLINTYPYYQPLYLLLANAAAETENQQNYFAKAALYNNGNILHRSIHETKTLIPIENAKLTHYAALPINQKIRIEVEMAELGLKVDLLQPKAADNENLNALTNPVIEGGETANSQENFDHAYNLAAEKQENAPTPFVVPEIENLEPLAKEVIAWEEEKSSHAFSTDDETFLAETKIATENTTKPIPAAPEIENLEPLQSEVIKVCDASADDFSMKSVESVESVENTKSDDRQEKSAEAHEPHLDKVYNETDEQETFEEIGDLVLPETQEAASQEATLAPKVVEQQEPADVETPEEGVEKAQVEETDTDKATPMADFPVESIASTDFFAFESFTSETTAELEKFDVSESLKFDPSPAAEHIVSKYDDDKMPFTFLWWLAKTRKDHQQIFQPYVSTTKQTLTTPDLQQQYVEHIFHLQAPLAPSTTQEEIKAPAKPLSKEHELIETFIKNEPQLKAPKPDQINNENKAKKSAEDNYDLVSETLAEIYIEQMLYHKAIDTYQKLSLKFPEKSRYFADLIQSLEKKI